MRSRHLSLDTGRRLLAMFLRLVDGENSDGCPADRSQACQHRAVPLKVIVPCILPGMEETNQVAGFRVTCCERRRAGASSWPWTAIGPANGSPGDSFRLQPPLGWSSCPPEPWPPDHSCAGGPLDQSQSPANRWPLRWVDPGVPVRSDDPGLPLPYWQPRVANPQVTPGGLASPASLQYSHSWRLRILPKASNWTRWWRTNKGFGFIRRSRVQVAQACRMEGP